VPARASWGSSLRALLVGTLLSCLILVPVGFALSAAHLLGLGFGVSTDGGSGWPWRIVGGWSAAADLAPHLAIGVVLAGAVSFYLPDRGDGRRSARWPIALCALAFGWPVSRGGYLGVSIGGGLIAMWIVTRLASGIPRRAVHLTPRLSAALAVLACGLVCVSLSYGALSPVTAPVKLTPISVVNGVSEPYQVQLDNTGPLPIHVLGITLTGTGNVGALVATRLEVPTNQIAHTIAGTYRTVRSVQIRAGASTALWPVITGPRDVFGLELLSTLRVRYSVAGMIRTENIQLPSQSAATVSFTKR
jgi:hypothetical protein